MKRNKQGFTMVELIVFLMLLGLVLDVAYMLLFNGINTFRASSGKYQLSSDLRSVTDFITSETRNVVDISIVALPITEQAGYSYFYLSGSKVVYRYNGTSTDKTEAIIDDANIFEITKDAAGNNYLKVSLTGQVDGQQSTVSTEILLNNITNKAADTGKAIQFKNP